MTTLEKIATAMTEVSRRSYEMGVVIDELVNEINRNLGGKVFYMPYNLGDEKNNIVSVVCHTTNSYTPYYDKPSHT